MDWVYAYLPSSLYLNITNDCPNRCSFCVRIGASGLVGAHLWGEGPDDEPTAEELLQAIYEKGSPAAFDEIVFCGFGEPTCRMEVVRDVGRTLRGEGARVRLNTNGQAALLCNEDPLVMLEGAVDAISVSLNAPTAERYNELCRPRFGEQAYPAVLAFLEACRHLDGVEVTASVVGFTLEHSEIEQCRQIARSLGVRFRVR